MLRFPPYAWVYVIKMSKGKPYYIGSTRNLLRRIKKHREMKLYFDYVEQTYPCNTYDDAHHLESYFWHLLHTTKDWKPVQLSRNEVEWMLKTARRAKPWETKAVRAIPEGW